MSIELVEHALASIIPAMTPAEYDALKDDIRRNGLLEPIVLFEGRILDGRHRYRACTELGINLATREIHGVSAACQSVALNCKRRHLTPSQVAQVGAEMDDIITAAEAAAKKRKHEGQQKGGETAGRSRSKVDSSVEIVPLSKAKARDDAGKVLGVNGKYLDAAKKIKREAPDLAEEVKAGTKTIPQAKNELRKREKVKELEEKAANAKMADGEPTWTLIHADVMDGLGSVRDHHAAPRLIFADPPYNIGIDYGDGEKADKLPYADYVHWCGEWIGYCWEILAADGSLWVMIGDEYAAEYAIALKRTGFAIRSWVKWYETFGVNCSRNFNRTSRHIFYCVRNSKAFVFNESAVQQLSARAAVYGDKRASSDGLKIMDDVWTIPRLTGTCQERIPQFPTQLPVELVSRIVGCASDPGDLVVDPFCGSATTGAACIALGRRFIGIEKSEQFVDLATKRLKVCQ